MAKREIFNPFNVNTAKPLLSGHPLSGQPLLGGQLSKSRNYSQYQNTVNNLLAAPIRLHLLFVPLFRGQQKCKVRSLSRGPPLNR